jgi:hypothetical protein
LREPRKRGEKYNGENVKTRIEKRQKGKREITRVK